jgi:hypothetical protein
LFVRTIVLLFVYIRLAHFAVAVRNFALAFVHK